MATGGPRIALRSVVAPAESVIRLSPGFYQTRSNLSLKCRTVVHQDQVSLYRVPVSKTRISTVDLSSADPAFREVFLDFNSIDVTSCWVSNGYEARCPYASDPQQLERKTVLVAAIAGIIILIITALTFFVKCNANRRNSRRRKRVIEGWEYEGVPSWDTLYTWHVPWKCCLGLFGCMSRLGIFIYFTSIIPRILSSVASNLSKRTPLNTLEGLDSMVARNKHNRRLFEIIWFCILWSSLLAVSPYMEFVISRVL